MDINGSRPVGDGDRQREVREHLRQLNLDIDRYAHRVARGLGIPTTDVHAAGILHAAPEGLSATELGRALSLTPSATTSLIDRMEAAGHATRRVSDVDARRARIEPTELVRQESRDRFAALNDAIARVMAQSTPEEAAAFADVLGRLAAEMKGVVEGR